MHSEFSLGLKLDQKPSCRWCYAALVFFLWWVGDVCLLLMVGGGWWRRHAPTGVVGVLNRIWCQNCSVSPWFSVMRMRGCWVGVELEGRTFKVSVEGLFIGGGFWNLGDTNFRFLWLESGLLVASCCLLLANLSFSSLRLPMCGRLCGHHAARVQQLHLGAAVSPIGHFHNCFSPPQAPIVQLYLRLIPGTFMGKLSLQWGRLCLLEQISISQVYIKKCWEQERSADGSSLLRWD